MRIRYWSSDVCSSDLTMVADILMDAGYRVFEACEAADALAILDGRDDIGAVFTDIEMPGGMTGLALAAAVRDRWPSMPVLVTSGRVRPGAGELPNGAAYIAKPYMPRSEEHASELQSLMRISYAVFCLKKKKRTAQHI